MKKFLRFVAIVLVGIIAVLLLGSAIAVGERTYSYMSRQKFSFEEAFSWAIDDFREYTDSIFAKPQEETILEFPIANWNIEVTACTSH